MMKRYCIFSAQYLPHLGGIERYTYNISKELVRTGNQVTIVTNNTTDSLTIEEEEGMEIYRFPCHALINGRFPIPKANKVFKEINEFLQKQDFDIVIINARFYIHSLYAAKYAKKKNIPCLCIDHGTSHLSVHNKILDYIGGIYEHVHTWILKKYCKNYYGVSKACCDWLKHFNISPRGTLYNAVDLEEIEKLKKGNSYDFRDKFSIKNDIAVVFTGRLLKEKGIRELIEAVELFNNNSLKKIHLLIAGDGDELEYVNTHQSFYVHPLGRLAFDEIIMLLEQSDIFCLPSFSEGFSTSALEAAACNCFIISTKRGGTKELVKGEEYGIILEDNSTERIYQALVKASNETEKRKNACRLCYDYLKEKFTWEKTVSVLKEECEKLE